MRIANVVGVVDAEFDHLEAVLGRVFLHEIERRDVVVLARIVGEGQALGVRKEFSREGDDRIDVLEVGGAGHRRHRICPRRVRAWPRQDR